MNRNDADYMSVRKSLNASLSDDSRQQCAQLFRDLNADIVALQEVENLPVLNVFHDKYIKSSGQHYGWRRLIDDNDIRGIEVAVISKNRIKIQSHKDITFDDLDLFNDEIADYGLSEGDKIFRRDCLEVETKVDGVPLTLFICHFKSMAGGRKATKCIREAEAKAVRKLVENKFGSNTSNSNWIILGDMNDYTSDEQGVFDEDTSLKSLFSDGFSFDIIERLKPEDRWTHYWAAKNTRSQIDHVYLSPKLNNENPDVLPKIIRAGQPYRVTGLDHIERYPRIGFDRPKASDHCPAVIDIVVKE